MLVFSDQLGKTLLRLMYITLLAVLNYWWGAKSFPAQEFLCCDEVWRGTNWWWMKCRLFYFECIDLDYVSWKVREQVVGNLLGVGSVWISCLLNGILQGFILYLLMFHVSNNNSDEGVKYTVLKFADVLNWQGRWEGGAQNTVSGNGRNNLR